MQWRITMFNIKKRSIVAVMVAGILFGTILGTFFALTQDLPQIRALESFQPSSTTRIYSLENKLLAKFYIEKRDPVPLSKMPAYLKQALIATEDRNFYHHSGIDLKGILRAIIKDVMAGEFVEGASTLTQQLAKTLFLTPKKSITRKLREAFLAFQIERRYTKDEIITLYLNQVYFGSGAYGVEAAANVFFGKSVDQLTLAQCALVAGMPKLPSRYSPLINKALATKRRNIVLMQMHHVGMIDADQYQRARAEAVPDPPEHGNKGYGLYFLADVKKQLEETIGPEILYRGGLSVFTTLSLPLQTAAENACENGLSALTTRMQQQEIENPSPQCALVSIDVPSGGILAMVGGRNHQKSSFNRATMAMRQPGSAFKPIVFALAVERGFPQNKLLLDAPIVFRGADNGNDWQPENFSRTYDGEMTMRTALARSKNIPAVRLMETLGPGSVISFARQFGIDAPLSPNLSLVLGTSEVTLLDLTAAYAVFPAGGRWVEPVYVLRVVDQNGRLIWSSRPEKQIVLSKTGAAIMADMLSGVVKEGTGRMAMTLGRPVAGKTGTTDQYKDALFIGFSPSVTTGVWVGQDVHETLGKGETGAKAALPIWIDYMEAALTARPYEAFGIPGDTVTAFIDPISGDIKLENDTGAVPALFKKGTEFRSR